MESSSEVTTAVLGSEAAVLVVSGGVEDPGADAVGVGGVGGAGGSGGGAGVVSEGLTAELVVGGGADGGVWLLGVEVVSVVVVVAGMGVPLSFSEQPDNAKAKPPTRRHATSENKRGWFEINFMGFSARR